jgi:hypothetical protein
VEARSTRRRQVSRSVLRANRSVHPPIAQCAAFRSCEDVAGTQNAALGPSGDPPGTRPWQSGCARSAPPAGFRPAPPAGLSPRPMHSPVVCAAAAAGRDLVAAGWGEVQGRMGLGREHRAVGVRTRARPQWQGQRKAAQARTLACADQTLPRPQQTASGPAVGLDRDAGVCPLQYSLPLARRPHLMRNSSVSYSHSASGAPLPHACGSAESSN